MHRALGPRTGAFEHAPQKAARLLPMHLFPES